MSTFKNIASFEMLFKQHYSFLVLVAFQVTKDNEIAEDIAQEFFIDLWTRRNEIEIKTQFQAYARAAVKNLSYAHLRRKTISVDFDSLNDADVAEADFLMAVEEVNYKQEADEKVLSFVDLLPAERKKLFLQYVVDGLSYAEIAKQNNISINTVKTQMKRAYAFLKERASQDPLLVIFISIILKKGHL